MRITIVRMSMQAQSPRDCDILLMQTINAWPEGLRTVMSIQQLQCTAQDVYIHAEGESEAELVSGWCVEYLVTRGIP